MNVHLMFWAVALPSRVYVWPLAQPWDRIEFLFNRAPIHDSPSAHAGPRPAGPMLWAPVQNAP